MSCLNFASALSLVRRYSNDPAAYAALGYLLLSNSGTNGNKRETLDRAVSAFRRATIIYQGAAALFVPAARGLAVAARRHRLMTGGPAREERRPSRAAGDAPANDNGGDSQQVGRSWLLRV